MRVVRAIGGRAPLHLTSTGKLFLSTGDTRQVRAYALRTGLAGHTRNSLTDLERLGASWPGASPRLRARQRGTGAGRALHRRRHLRRYRQKLVAGLSISAPAERLQDEWIKSLVDTAASISERWATSRRSRAVPMD